MSVYSLENEAFVSLLKYGSIVLLKLVAMSPITSVYRGIYKSVASEEDAKLAEPNDKEKQKKLMAKNPGVERARLAHLNDLENIVPFFLIAMLYVTIAPNAKTADFIFKIFAGSRILHTIVYLGKVRQPARGLAFMAGFCVNCYMLFQIMTVVLL
ncbi:microsomal glutathione S-transferase 1-like isoform X3 [Styela clava]|uniref:microsomal glutathione S-transferase 1-like isoform X2 n=1 Tax=Styela clava TaxID=7725 RepID=UPI00193A0709|nr:microsomal glutathione S-transferase 1-like isoform X2 [Styela clava]